MLGQAVITFREVLEAALIVAITLAYLARTGRSGQARHVWSGVVLAVGASLAVGAAVAAIVGTLDEAAMTLFEGTTALLAVAILTTMILWMASHGPGAEDALRKRLGSATSGGTVLALVAFAFVVVFREGLETVLFLTPLGGEEPVGTIAGAAIGIGAAMAFSYALLRTGARMDLRRFFYITSVLLVLLAGGLAGYGVHELIEHQEEVGADVGWFGSTAYDLGIPSSSPLHHKGIIGSVPAVMFGYAASMEWGRVIVHLAYLAVFLPLTVALYTRPGLVDRLMRLMRLRSPVVH
jgi:high-affinity iron transporter